MFLEARVSTRCLYFFGFDLFRFWKLEILFLLLLDSGQIGRRSSNGHFRREGIKGGDFFFLSCLSIEKKKE